MNSQAYKALACVFGSAAVSALAIAQKSADRNLPILFAVTSALAFSWTLWLLFSPSKRRAPETFFENGHLIPLSFERKRGLLFFEVTVRIIAGTCLCLPALLLPTERLLWGLFLFGIYLLASGRSRIGSHLLQTPRLLFSDEGITYLPGKLRPKFFAWHEVAKVSFHRLQSKGNSGSRLVSVIAGTEELMPPECLCVRHKGVKKAMRVKLDTFGNPRAVAYAIEAYLALKTQSEVSERKSA